MTYTNFPKILPWVSINITPYDNNLTYSNIKFKHTFIFLSQVIFSFKNIDSHPVSLWQWPFQVFSSTSAFTKSFVYLLK